jgi:probable F420-dependent oxidoreductase
MNADVPITLGAKVPNSGPLPERPGIPAMAAALEKAGFESLWVSDHVVMPAEIHSRYPFAADGRATWPTDTPYYDAIVAMTLIAAATTTARIGPAVLVLPQREPVLLAKQLASLDALSGGRIELGVGAGWLAEEFAALDVPFDSRGSRLVEWIALLRDCWTGRPQPHEGRHYTLPADVLTRPTPAHHIPLYVGGHTPAVGPGNRPGRTGRGPPHDGGGRRKGRPRPVESAAGPAPRRVNGPLRRGGPSPAGLGRGRRKRNHHRRRLVPPRRRRGGVRGADRGCLDPFGLLEPSTLDVGP